MRILLSLVLVFSWFTPSLTYEEKTKEFKSESALSKSFVQEIVKPKIYPVTSQRYRNFSQYSEVISWADANDLPSTEVNSKTLVVVFNHKLGIAEQIYMSRKTEILSSNQLDFANSLQIYIIDCANRISCTQSKEYFDGLASVISTSYDYKYRVAAEVNDPGFTSTWGLQAINAPNAWKITTGASSVTVGVVDTGIDLDHPDLRDNLWVNSGEIPDNGKDDDNNGYVDDIHGWDFVDEDNVPNDDLISGGYYGHGTHVAGTIGASANNGIGVAGISWNSRLMALRVCTNLCYMSDVLRALQYAYTNGAQVANLSLGSQKVAVEAERLAIEAIGRPAGGLRKGVLVVAAAGNDSSDNDEQPFHPANYRLNNLISVAASNKVGNKASFSNYGLRHVDVAAPGENIYSTIPDGAFGQTGHYGMASGTSMAAPHVAGVAALLLAIQPNWTASDLRQKLISSVTSQDDFSDKVFSGGIIDAYKAVTGAEIRNNVFVIRQHGTGLGEVQYSEESFCSQAVCRTQLSGVATLRAEANSKSYFEGWFGDCESNGTSCKLEPNIINTVVNVVFNRPSGNGVSLEDIQASKSIPTYTSTTHHYHGNQTYSQISADGDIRAKTVFRWPSDGSTSPWCWYETSDTGGVVIEEKIGNHWIEKKQLTAPTLDSSRPAGRVANCRGFGTRMHLSADGRTLVIDLGSVAQLDSTNPDNDWIKCGFAIYRRDAYGNWSDAQIIQPKDKYHCLHTFYQDANRYVYNTEPHLTMSDDGKVVFYAGSYGKVLRYDISNFNKITNTSFTLPNECLLLGINSSKVGNLTTDGAGSVLSINTHSCLDGSIHLIALEANNDGPIFLSPNKSLGSRATTVKSAWSTDGKILALSYHIEPTEGLPYQGVRLFEVKSGLVTFLNDLRLTEQIDSLVLCHQFTEDNLKLICDMPHATVGRNQLHGKLMIFSAIQGDWDGEIIAEDVWVTNQYLHKNKELQLFSDATADGNYIETSIHGFAIEPRNKDTVGTRFTLRRPPQIDGKIEFLQVDESLRIGELLHITGFKILSALASNIVIEWWRCDFQIGQEIDEIPDFCSLAEASSAPRYRISSKDLKRYILVRITASNQFGKLSSISKSTKTSVVEVAPEVVVKPSITGIQRVGETLLGNDGSWSSVTDPVLKYHWYRCLDTRQESCQKLIGEHSSNYWITSSDLDRWVMFEVTAQNSGGTTTSQSELIGPIRGFITRNVDVSIGKKRNKVSAKIHFTSLGTPAPLETYQWYLCSRPVKVTAEFKPLFCKVISSATGKKYKPKNKDRGKFLVFSMTYSNRYDQAKVFTKSISWP